MDTTLNQLNPFTRTQYFPKIQFYMIFLHPRFLKCRFQKGFLVFLHPNHISSRT